MITIKSITITVCCLDCGEKDIRVLEFDHVKDTKINDVSSLVWRACSIQTIKNEIKKCEVVCANCHRIRTSERKLQRK